MKRTPESVKRAAVWWVLWRDNRAGAVRLCDEIIRSRPVPEKLLEALRMGRKSGVRQVKGR